MKATSETMLPSEHLWAMMEASKVGGNLIVMSSEHMGKDSPHELSRSNKTGQANTERAFTLLPGLTLTGWAFPRENSPIGNAPNSEPL